MKKLLILLFSIFFLRSPSVFANDISDFTMEGMSIGDSLLDYMTKEEILEEIEKRKDLYQNFKEPNKYQEIYLFKDFPTYDFVSFFIKNNSTNEYVGNKNEKYTILSIYGSIDYINDFNSCIQKRDEIAGIISEMFPNAQKTENIFKHQADPSGDSTLDDISFRFDSGEEVEAECEDFDETFRIKKNWGEGLNISISSAEILSWLRNK